MVTTVVWPARQTPSAEVVFEKQKHTSTYLLKLYLSSKTSMFLQNAEKCWKSDSEVNFPQCSEILC